MALRLEFDTLAFLAAFAAKQQTDRSATTTGQPTLFRSWAGHTFDGPLDDTLSSSTQATAKRLRDDRLKRAVDLTIASAVLLAFLPLLLLVAAAIRMESPGPVLFRQRRFGRDGKPITVLKFRSMFTDRGDATGAARTLARDPRVTFVGRILRRSSVDELPQLLNVLRGDMSLVGPRPHAIEMKVEGCYYANVAPGYHQRHCVLPGLTGWAQINGSRGEVDTVAKACRRVELDLWYVRNRSLLLDLRIILLTAFGGILIIKAD